MLHALIEAATELATDDNQVHDVVKVGLSASVHERSATRRLRMLL